jgi:hypothetical protein
MQRAFSVVGDGAECACLSGRGCTISAATSQLSCCWCCCHLLLPGTQYNSLNQLLPLPDDLHSKLLRSAAIGFCAGVASDTISNR